MLSATACVSAGPAAASAPRARVGSEPRLPAAARVTGSVRRSQAVSLTLSLSSRNALEMQRMATEVSTPGSPLYRHYLSVAQFARRFGATPAQIAAVDDALRAQGLHVSPIDANHLTLEVSGSAARVQRAFATRLARVRLPDGRSAVANRDAPTLPAAIAPDVDAVVGLNTLFAPESDQVVHAARAPADHADAAPHAIGHVATGGPQPCVAATSAAAAEGGYTADEIAAAYNFSGLYAAGDSGAGQTIAVYELETLIPADVAAYQACYGTAVPVSYIDVDHPKATSTDEESALDVEQVIGLAPGAAIDVYQAPDTASGSVAGYAKIVSQDRARTISTSWGACEAKITLDRSDLSLVKSENTLFEEAALQGQSILAASGDTGSAGCIKDTGGGQLAVQDPSSQPYATGVGGTSLYTEANGQPALWNPAVPTNPLLQSVWNDRQLTTGEGETQPAATSGGISTLWSMPAYQKDTPKTLGVINTYSSGKPCKSSSDCREVPDISADGDPGTGYLIYTTSDAGPAWSVEGGTSAAAPLWAALTAEANALPSCRGAALGFENPALYALSPGQPGDLTDITAASPITGAANNDATGRNRGLYPVTAGYDMATGLGTPNAAAVAGGLCALRAPVYTVSVITPQRPQALLHTKFTYQVRGADSGKLALTYTAKGLPSGLRISKTGLITGKATKVGAAIVTVTATDHATNTASVTFPLTVVTPPPTLTKVSLTGVSRRRPELAFTVTKGRYAPQVRSVALLLPPGLSFGRHGGGIHLSAGGHRVRFHVTRQDGVVTITFTSVQARVGVTIGRPTLFASATLARSARLRGAKVAVGITVTDKLHRATPRTYRLALKK